MICAVVGGVDSPLAALLTLSTDADSWFSSLENALPPWLLSAAICVWMLVRSALILLAELAFKVRLLRFRREVRSEATCLHALALAVCVVAGFAVVAGLAVCVPGLAVCIPGLVMCVPGLIMCDPGLVMCDPECMDALAAGAAVCGAAALLALLLLVPELQAARVTAAHAISTAAAVLTDAKGLAGLTALTCDCLTMRTWSPADAT